MACSPPDPSDAPTDPSPDWTGFWRVRRWDGAAPDVPTYYVATTDSWDVVKRDPHSDPQVAPHPILEVDGDTIILKDEGVPDEAAERWEVDVEDEALRVTAQTGPHAGAMGMAERIATDPRGMEADPLHSQ